MNRTTNYLTILKEHPQTTPLPQTVPFLSLSNFPATFQCVGNFTYEESEEIPVSSESEDEICQVETCPVSHQISIYQNNPAGHIIICDEIRYSGEPFLTFPCDVINCFSASSFEQMIGALNRNRNLILYCYQVYGTGSDVIIVKNALPFISQFESDNVNGYFILLSYLQKIKRIYSEKFVEINLIPALHYSQKSR